MIDDSVLDALASELEEAVVRGQAVDANAVAEKFGVAVKAVEDLRRAFAALGEPASDRAPDRIDRYRIDGELGRGGMGVVYRAVDLVLRRPVALKIMRADRGSPQRAERFRREIMALGRVRHPNVVLVLASGEDAQGRTFVVMQMVEGQSLAARLRSGSLPPRAAATLVLKLAEALAEVHAAGILHRDLKPSNVMLSQSGDPLLTDFGLVRDLAPDGWTRLTKTGQVMGSPGYWSPEQAMGKPVAETTDVYGLGGLLYACLTREPPTASTAALVEAVAAAVSGMIVPPSELCPDLDSTLERICMQALATDPLERTQSASALARELRAWLDTGHVVEPEINRAVRVGLGALLGVALLLVVAIVVIVGRPKSVALPDTKTPTAVAPLPVPSDDLLAQARDKHGDRAHQEVLDLVRRVLEEDPTNGEALLLRARANRALGALAAGISDCTELIELEPKNADAWALRAVLYGLRAQNDKSLADSSRALELDPKHVVAWLERAAARAMSGDPKGAIADYGEAIVIDPNNVKARLRRGGAHYQLGEWAKAIVDCDAAIKVGNHPKAYEIRAEARSRLGDWKGAEEDATHSLKLHDCMAPRVSRAAARMMLGKTQEAVDELRYVLERCLPGDRLIPHTQALLREALATQERNAALDRLAR